MPSRSLQQPYASFSKVASNARAVSLKEAGGVDEGVRVGGPQKELGVLPGVLQRHLTLKSIWL